MDWATGFLANLSLPPPSRRGRSTNTLCAAPRSETHPGFVPF
jgi:hypothetical protein